MLEKNSQNEYLQELLDEFKGFIKEKKIPRKKIREEMGYSRAHFDGTLSGGRKPSSNFLSLLLRATKKILINDYIEFHPIQNRFLSFIGKEKTRNRYPMKK